MYPKRHYNASPDCALLDIEENQVANDAVPMRLLLKHYRTEKGWSQEHLADLMGISRITLNRLENGKRDIKSEYLESAAKALEIAVADLFAKPTIPVVGYVGAGAEVFAVDDYAKGDGMDQIEPEGYYSQSAVAVIIRGNSMYDQYHDGDILVYDERRGDVENFVGRRECIVGLADDRIMVKRVIRGSADGLFTLTSSNFPPISDVAVMWCARIRSVKYREE